MKALKILAKQNLCDFHKENELKKEYKEETWLFMERTIDKDTWKNS